MGGTLNLATQPIDSQGWLPNRTSRSALLHKKSDLIERPPRFKRNGVTLGG